ncbi:hypothetical protein ACIRRA_13475 [Nocardia sp. NPDC101769]|uniref:hypothetical protein n=1 Tax=Nocardia sp. NPDC101769 TaxID=3364333 RepID=UPI003805ACC6
MTAARRQGVNTAVREWMWQAFTRIRGLHEQMDATTDPVVQQQLSDESEMLAAPWEASPRFAADWRQLWWDNPAQSTDAVPATFTRMEAERDGLAIRLADAEAERDRLRLDNATLRVDRAELAGQLVHALDERDRLQHLVHELEVEVDDALDLAAPHVLDAEHERLITRIPCQGAPRPQVVMQQ